METSFFEGPDPSARPLAGGESLPALHLLERGGIMTTAAGEVSADLATSGRRHSSLDSARSAVPGRETIQQVRDWEGEAARARVQGSERVTASERARARERERERERERDRAIEKSESGGARKEEEKNESKKTTALSLSLFDSFQKHSQCDVMSEDEPGLLKHLQQSKQRRRQQQHEIRVGSEEVEEEEEEKNGEVGATRAPEEEAPPEEAAKTPATAAAAAPLPPPPAAPSSHLRVPAEGGAGGGGGEAPPPPPPTAPPQRQQREQGQQALAPLHPAAAAAVAAARAHSASPDFVCCDPAVPAYVERYSRVAARLARAMDEGPEDDSPQERAAHDALLLSLIGECGAAVRTLRDARCAALDAGRVAEVAAGAFVHPGQRLLAWMGGVRPSDYLACARAMLAVWGEALSPEAAAALSQLQAAVAEQQQSMTAAFSELSERLARTAAVARYVRASCAAREEEGEEGGEEGEREEGEEGETSGSGSDFGCAAALAAAAAAASGAEGAEDGGPSPRRPSRRRRRPAATPRAADRLLEAPSPAACGIVDDMRALLRHADELRALVAARASEPPPGGLLSARQQALFWLCVQDIIELDARPTPRARPRAALGGGGGLSVRRPPEGARGR